MTSRPSEAGIATLIDMLRTRRPYNSAGEQAFVDRFLMPLGVTPDVFGNLWMAIGEVATILWSSHTDTVHRGDGTQCVAYDNGIIRLAAGATSNCLGADCTAGVWLMTEMIRARVPGIYVFHRGEERGGLGSRYVAEVTPERLHGLSAAIAFDRRGTGSIITHQLGGRCASDTFALSLAACLRLNHEPDPTGSFTDTASYAHLVGECSNISVGYDREHSRDETLDTRYLFALRNGVLSADFSQLIFERTPVKSDRESMDEYPRGQRNFNRLYELVFNHAEGVAAFLDDIGIVPADLHDYVDTAQGRFV